MELIEEISNGKEKSKSNRKKELAKSASNLMQKLRKQAEKTKRIADTTAEELHDEYEEAKKKKPALVKIDKKIKDILQKYKEFTSVHKNINKKTELEYKEFCTLVKDGLVEANNVISDSLICMQELQKSLKAKSGVYNKLSDNLKIIDDSARNFYQDITLKLSELSNERAPEDSFKFRDLPTEEELILLNANKKLSAQDTDFLKVSAFTINNDTSNMPKPKKKKQQRGKGK